ncbi:MAG TPA: hypothetical protein VJ890_25430 [Vineibacter sp.]|nr:hypothetical protein [Vineibacter sp.]
MRGWVALVAGLAATLIVGAAQAEVIERRHTGTWLIEANAERGQFQNCSASGEYGAGTAVVFLLTRDFVWGLAIRNPAWNWRADSEGDVTYWVDSYSRRQGRANALSPTELLIPLSDSQQLFHEIRLGNNMYFEPHGVEGFSITLVGTAVALNEMMACVNAHR